MVTAQLNGTLLAESADTVVVEGNHYFPRASVNPDYLVDSDHTTVCGWKGTASYYSLEVDGEQVPNGAWYYPEAKAEAGEITDHIAFYTSKVQVG